MQNWIPSSIFNQNRRKQRCGKRVLQKAKYGGMEASDIKRLKELEEENRRLKQSRTRMVR